MAKTLQRRTMLTTFLLLSNTISLSLTLPALSYFGSTLYRYQQMLQDPEGLTYDVPTLSLRAEYDFIVIGAGPGGATVTNRLTEVPKWNVLLLEAGGDEFVFTDIPLFSSLLTHTPFNWGYRAEPQKGACLGFKDQRCSWPKGKGMGGSTIINYLVYSRGHPKDYDGWRDMGNPGWGWKDVFKYYLKSENAKGTFEDSPYHSKGGYLDIQQVPFSTPLSKSFLDSASETGYPIIDYNSGVDLIGFSLLQTTMRQGYRVSSSKAFLRPIRNRPNLHVAKFAHVTKILIDPQTKKAYGVLFYRDGKIWSVKAKKEVILSAGVVNTPQLLMLSGIGAKEHLESHKIKVIQDLPGVGQNVQDHVAVSGLTFLVNDSVGITEKRLISNFRYVTDYFRYGKGPLTLSGGAEGLANIRTKIARTPKDYPDIELVFAPGHLGADNGRALKTSAGISDSLFNEVYASTNNKHGWTILPITLQPGSRGYIKLRNKNPFSKPLMYGNYFDDEHDLDILIEGIKFIIKLSKTKAFQRYNSTLHTTPIPACKTFTFGSDDYWRCLARQLTTVLQHQCGSAKMGPRDDPWAVVDPELRVHGVQGLRVVDVSIIPRIPAAHTVAPAYMIAEKASDMIKKTYGK